MLSKAIFSATAIAVLAGCAAPRVQSEAVAGTRDIPTRIRSEVWTGRISGRLSMRGPCLTVKANRGGEDFLLIWPEGTRFDGRRVAVPATPEAPAKVLALGRNVSFDGSNLSWDAIGHLPALHRFRGACELPLFFVVNVR